MNAFNLWVGLGASLGLWRVWRSAPDHQAENWLNTALLVLTAALTGARLFYVLENWGFYAQNPLEILAIWQGGLSWPGAAAGSGLAVICLALCYQPPKGQRMRGGPLGIIADRLYPLLPTLAVTAWLGCWQVGAAYGVQVSEDAWWALLAPDERGLVSPRFPLQPLAALTLLIFFWLIEARIKPLQSPGRLAGVAAAGLLLHLLAASLLIGSPAPTWKDLRIDTWFAVLYLAIFTGWVLIDNLVVRIWRKQPYSSI